MNAEQRYHVEQALKSVQTATLADCRCSLCASGRKLLRHLRAALR